MAFPREPRSDEHVPVLVVGGALVGLSAAVFLAAHDVPCLVVERHPDLLLHPRLRGLTPRTVELYRQVGLEPAIRAAAYAPPDQFRWMPVRAETLGSEQYEAVEEPDDRDETGDASPSPMGPIDQDQLEILLRARAIELGAGMRFGTEVTAVEQDDGGVTAVLEDRRTGASSTVRADYLIAADGAGSSTRQRLGVEVDGPGAFFSTITVMVDADLREAMRGRPVSIAYLSRPRPGTVLMAHDNVGCRWVFGMGYSPEHGESVDDFTDERLVELVRTAAGLPDADVVIRPQIPGTDLKVLGFTIGAHLARRYRVGRIFLAGDAAHIVPPTGGLGGNTGVQDAHNLAWKLAAVLHGQAGPALLDTYQAERQPVGRLTMDQALARWGARVAGGDQGGGALIAHAAVALGYQYRSEAVRGAAEDGTPAWLPDQLRGGPGTRAPHLVMERAGMPLSTLDLYGRGFVLLTGAEGIAWAEAVRAATDATGIAIDVHRVGVDLVDVTERFCESHGIGPAGALLVRPDGFVAWRQPEGPESAGETLAQVLDAILGRSSVGGTASRADLRHDVAT